MTTLLNFRHFLEGLLTPTENCPTYRGNALNTQFTIEMLKRGFLAFRQFKPSLAHHSADLESYKVAVDEVFAVLAADPTVSQLDTPVHHAGFQRLTRE